MAPAKSYAVILDSTVVNDVSGLVWDVLQECTIPSLALHCSVLVAPQRSGILFF